MGQIAGIPRLRMLMAQGTVATDDGFEVLSASKTIEYIWGPRVPQPLRPRLHRATSMPSLKGLAVSCARVDDEALSSLAHSGLTSLLPMTCPTPDSVMWGAAARTGAPVVHVLSRHDRRGNRTAGWPLALEVLTLAVTKISDRSLEILSRLTTLERLEFWEIAGITDAGLKVLATLPALRELTIGGSSQVSLRGLSHFWRQINVTQS